MNENSFKFKIPLDLKQDLKMELHEFSFFLTALKEDE